MDSKTADALLSGTNSPSLSPVLSADALTPKTNAAVADLHPPPAPGPMSISETAPNFSVPNLAATFQEQNQQGDIPLDVTSGADILTRMGVSFRRTPKDQAAYLQNKFGKGSVRVATDGTPIIRVMDPASKKPKDILLKEVGMRPGDIADLAGQTPEMLMGILGSLRGNPSAFKSVLRMAAFSEATGAAKDVMTRALDKQNIDLPEIMRARQIMTAQDIGVGAALGAVGKGITKVISPNPKVAEGIFKQQAEAVQHFADKGITLPRTPGETTGIGILLRGEAVASKLPGSAGTLKAVVEQQNAEMQKIQNLTMGLPAEATPADYAARPTFEEVGTKAQEALGAKVGEKEAAAETAQREVAETGSKEVKQLAGVPKAPIDTVALGGDIRKSALAKREAFQAASVADYEKVYSHPLAQQRNLSVDALADEASKLIKNLPTGEVFTTIPTLVGPLRTQTGTKVMRNFVPSNVMTKLQDIADLKGGKMRLGDLLKMRTDVANDIAQGEAIPGVDTGYLKKIRGMLSDTIDKELDKLPDDRAIYDQLAQKARNYALAANPNNTAAEAENFRQLEAIKKAHGGMPPNPGISLKTLWQTANDNYAKGVKPFQKSGISELFKEPEQGSAYLGENEIVQRAISGTKGTDIFNTYRDFFGATSPEFTGLKQAVSDRVVGNAADSLSGMIDAGQLVRNLDNLVQNNPQVADQVFGRKALNSMYAVADFMQAGKTKLGNVASKLEGNIRIADVQNAAARGELTAQSLRTLVEQEKQYGDMLRNKIMRQIAGGQFTGEHIKPSDFVNYFSTQADPSEITQVLSHLSDHPQVLEDIRSKTAQQLFERAYPSAKAIDNPALLSGEPMVLTQEGLQNALGNETQRARYRSILGADTYKDIEELTKFLAPRQYGEQAFRAAGGLAGGMIIAGMLRRGELKYATEAAKLWILGKAYTSPVARDWLQNTLISKESGDKVARYFISSAPIVESLYREFPKRKAEQIAASLGQSVSRYESEQTGQNKSREDEFRRLLDQAAPLPTPAQPQ